MSRLGLIEENREFSDNEGFILSDESGIRKVTLLSIIGSGGTAIAYKGICEENGTKKVCVIKEYFPRGKEQRGIYKREKVGDEIRILKEYRDVELALQEKNVLHELRTSQTVFFDPQIENRPDFNNNPYVYFSEIFCRLGDSSYILLDTSEGESLYSVIRKAEREAEGISLDYVVRVLRQIVEVVGHLHDRGFVHCDIKPQNIWMRGSNENENICLLDFGSTFRMKECFTQIDNMRPEEIVQRAEKLFDIEGLGSSTSDYCSKNVVMINNCRRSFLEAKQQKNATLIQETARTFLESINAIGISDDLHSAIRILKEMYDLTQLEEDDYERTYEVLVDILEKNDAQGYMSTGELLDDLNILETVAHRGAHPLVLEKAASTALDSFREYETIEELLCDVEVIE